MLLSLLIAAPLALAQSSSPANASQLTISVPRSVVEVDSGKLGGALSRLAWSPDGRELYLQATERDRFGNVKAHHYVLALDGTASRPLDQEPAWANTYWAWKSFPSAPGQPAIKIALESQRGLVRATAAPRGGDLARGGQDGGTGSSGPSTEELGGIANQTQGVVTQTMRLKGEVLGEWVNTSVTPGTTFGWAPSAFGGVIAFSDRTGHLVVMDAEGRKNPLGSTKNVSLPAWSDDGKQLAFLQKKDKKKFLIFVADVAR